MGNPFHTGCEQKQTSLPTEGIFSESNYNIPSNSNYYDGMLLYYLYHHCSYMSYSSIIIVQHSIGMVLKQYNNNIIIILQLIMLKENLFPRFGQQSDSTSSYNIIMASSQLNQPRTQAIPCFSTSRAMLKNILYGIAWVQG